MMKLVLKAAARVIGKQVEKINDLKAEQSTRVEEAFARGLKEARSRYAQAWVQGSGRALQDVEFTAEFVRVLGAQSKVLLEHALRDPNHRAVFSKLSSNMASLGLKDVRLAVSIGQALGWYFGGEPHEQPDLFAAVVDGVSERAREFGLVDVSNAFDLVRLEVPSDLHKDVERVQRLVEERLDETLVS